MHQKDRSAVRAGQRMLCSLTGLPDATATDPYDEKKYRGAGLKEVQTWWKTCKDWMARYKTHSEPFIYDIKKLLKALSDKKAVSRCIHGELRKEVVD